jgi:two-component system NtrC family sensor kinase
VSDFRVLVASTDQDFSAALTAVLAAQLSAAATDTIDPLRLRAKPEAMALVVDARADASGARAVARAVRAMGFGGALVLVGTRADALGDAEMGAATVAADRIAFDLVERIGEQMTLASAPFADQVMRARRLVAAGEIALRLQHALNNPLAGLLAESQLMLMDPQTPDQQASLERVVGLCRRMIEMTRSLDGLGERRQSPPTGVVN